MKELHAIGVDNPADLVRVLEEEDPFSVRSHPVSYFVLRVCRGTIQHGRAKIPE